MLTARELVDVERALRDEWVLSIYVDPRRTDPAARGEWRRMLGQRLGVVRRSTAAASADEREASTAALAHLESWLAEAMERAPTRPWAAFVTRDGVRHAATLPTAPRAQAWWGRGPRIAAYGCAVSPRPPVLVALADADRVRLLRQRAGEIEELETIGVPHAAHEFLHTGDAPRPGFRAGARGAAATDTAQRQQRHRRHRLARAAAERLGELDRDHEWIALGGAPEPLATLRAALPSAVRERVFVLPALSGAATLADIGRAVDQGAVLLRRLNELVLVDELLASYGADGAGAAGQQATERALASRAVRHLLLTPSFMERHADSAEAVVRAALEQGAQVDTMLGAAAERLDRDAGGIGASLRFAPAVGAVPTPAGASQPT
jgi:hypothetical protein